MEVPGIAVGPAYRAMMLGAAGRLAIVRGESAGALTRALVSTAAGRRPAAETELLERIAWRRTQLAADHPELAETVAWLSITPLWGAFLTRLVAELRPRSVVELGTGFGLSTLHLAAGLEVSGAGSLATFDEFADWVDVAEEGLARVRLGDRVEVNRGEIDRTLPDALAAIGQVDLAFLDADKPGTRRHFGLLLPYLPVGAVLIFDDIDFDDAMRTSWRAITRHVRVRAAIGLRRVGLVVLG